MGFVKYEQDGFVGVITIKRVKYRGYSGFRRCS